jgi:DNA polymerase/3'-5' exonuclease PolX
VATTLPRNAQVAEQFDLLADLLELDGEEQFRVLAYRRAADQIRSAAGPIAELALEGEAKKLPGIGKTIESKIDGPERRCGVPPPAGARPEDGKAHLARARHHDHDRAAASRRG